MCLCCTIRQLDTFFTLQLIPRVLIAVQRFLSYKYKRIKSSFYRIRLLEGGNPQDDKALFSFNNWKSGALRQVVEIPVGIDHVEQHGLAFFRSLVKIIWRLCIAPARERGTSWDTVQIHAQIDRSGLLLLTAMSFWAREVVMSCILLSVVVVHNLKVIIDFIMRDWEDV